MILISEILFQAVRNIRRCQREMPDWYGGDDVKSEIEKVVNAMQQAQAKLDDILLGVQFNGVPREKADDDTE